MKKILLFFIFFVLVFVCKNDIKIEDYFVIEGIEDNEIIDIFKVI